MAGIKDAPDVSLVPLHELNASQWRDLCRIMSDDRVTRWLSTGAEWTREKLLKLREYSAHDAGVAWRSREYFYWGIVREKDARLQGIIGLHPSLREASAGAGARGGSSRALQVMIAIDPDEQGRGIAGRALHALITADTLARVARRVQVIVREDNARSVAAFEKSGHVARAVDVPQFTKNGATFRVYDARAVA